MALAAYRHLLRATRIAFEGDLPLLHAARTQARVGFDKNKELVPTSQEATTAIAHAEGVSEVLVKNIVQGKRAENSGDVYKLNIHDQTERGHNDTISNPFAPGGKVKIGGT